MTACGAIGLSQDVAVDQLRGNVPRGRVIVRKGLKRDLLDYLERIGVTATAIDYPGADKIAAKLCRTGTR